MTQTEDSEWRRQATTRTIAPFQGALGVHPAGSMVVKQAMGRLEDGRVVVYDAPSPVALALGAARDNCARAEALRAQITIEESKAHPFEGLELFHIEPTTTVFDFQSSCLATVVFSFFALEYLANEVMERYPDTIVEVPTKFETGQDGKQHVTKWNKLPAKSLERKSADMKLGVILPQLLGCPSPEELELWERFVRLRELRNDIVHLKGQAINPKVFSIETIDTDSPLLRFFNTSPSQHVATSFDMVTHFSGHIPWAQFDWLESFQSDPK